MPTSRLRVFAFLFRRVLKLASRLSPAHAFEERVLALDLVERLRLADPGRAADAGTHGPGLDEPAVHERLERDAVALVARLADDDADRLGSPVAEDRAE